MLAFEDVVVGAADADAARAHEHFAGEGNWRWTLGDDEFATSTNTTQPLAGSGPHDDVTDDDIERAIAEIQSAIRKVPR